MKALFVVAATVVLLGCGSDAPPASGLTSTLQYTRSGGIAGVSVGATVKADGNGTFGDRRKGMRKARLTAAERERLTRLIRAADLAHLKVDSRSECCDRFDYTLAYGGHTLRWSNAHVPKALNTLVGEIEKLITKYGGVR